MASLRSWLRSVADGFGSITLDPSPRLRRLREQSEREIVASPARGPLPPLPDSAYAPGAVPLDTWDYAWGHSGPCKPGCTCVVAKGAR